MAWSQVLRFTAFAWKSANGGSLLLRMWSWFKVSLFELEYPGEVWELFCGLQNNYKKGLQFCEANYNKVGNGNMHPVQEHTNTPGIDCSIQRPTEYIYINTKGTVFQPRVLQWNLDNMNQLPHSKHPDRKKIEEFADAGIEPTTFCVLGRCSYLIVCICWDMIKHQ